MKTQMQFNFQEYRIKKKWRIKKRKKERIGNAEELW